MSNKFDLPQIAGKLESLEESILFRLLDRAQYKHNEIVYEPGAFPLGNEELSLVDYMHRFGEETFSVLGRYTIAEERPFFNKLPSPAPTMAGNNEGLHINDINNINLTADIKASYVKLLRELTLEGEDGDFGTTAEYDIASLQAIARRIHFGSFYVAECKYLDNPTQYQNLIESKDTEALMGLLTRQEIEDRIIERIKKKCDQIQSISNPEIRRSVDSEILAQFYFKTIIPLTKEGELSYLLWREV